jgi:hypothetical protein
MNEKQLKEIIKFYKDLLNINFRSFTTENEKYHENLEIYEAYFHKYLNIINTDVQNSVRFYSENKNKEYHGQFDEVNDNLNNQTILVLFVNLHIFYRLFRMKDYETKRIKDFQDFKISDLDTKVTWYRGQSNASWQIIPSFFRDSSKTKLWSWDEVISEYNSKPNKNSISMKLNELDIKINDQPYRTVSYVQHAISFSPIVDFTKSLDVALSFALSKSSSLSSYYEVDSSVYELKMNTDSVLHEIDKIDKALRDSKVQVFSRNEYLVNVIRNEMWTMMLKGLESIIYLIDFPTNDRMLYQKGTFILFNNTIVIGSDIFLSYNKVSFLKNHLVKNVIPCAKKEEMLKSLLRNTPHYRFRYLMDPYLFLDEIDL